MAKQRDIIVAIIIGFSFVVALFFFGIMFIGLLSSEGDLDLAGLGGDVGVVEMFGVIDELSGRPVIKQIERWADNSSIKAIVVHLDTPGGGVAISQEIYDTIKRARDKKPVVAAMASMAASGGYYIACATDRIVANPGTLTGSIGVIFQFHEFGELMEKVGIGTETITSGDLKDVGSYSRSMTKKEELMIRSVVMDTYEQFVGAVAEGRGMDNEEVYPMADGSIFTGLQAYNLGLVDTLGGFREAVELAGELAGMEGEPKVVRPYRRKKLDIFDLFQGLLGRFSGVVNQEYTGPQVLFLYK